MPLHSSLGNRARLHLKKKEKSGIGSPMYTPSELFVEFLLLALEHLNSAGLEALVLVRGTEELPAGGTVKVLVIYISINLKL